jgi:hypothetical protein
MACQCQIRAAIGAPDGAHTRSRHKFSLSRPSASRRFGLLCHRRRFACPAAVSCAAHSRIRDGVIEGQRGQAALQPAPVRRRASATTTAPATAWAASPLPRAPGFLACRFVRLRGPSALKMKRPCQQQRDHTAKGEPLFRCHHPTYLRSRATQRSAPQHRVPAVFLSLGAPL